MSRSTKIIFGLVVIVALIVGGVIFFIVGSDEDENLTENNDETTETSMLNEDLENTPTVYNASQLELYDGVDGRQCWVAIGDKVYDLTNSEMFNDGQHTPAGESVPCGQAYTLEDLEQSPHGDSVLENDLDYVGDYMN